MRACTVGVSVSYFSSLNKRRCSRSHSLVEKYMMYHSWQKILLITTNLLSVVVSNKKFDGISATRRTDDSVVNTILPLVKRKQKQNKHHKMKPNIANPFPVYFNEIQLYFMSTTLHANFSVNSHSLLKQDNRYVHARHVAFKATLLLPNEIPGQNLKFNFGIHSLIFRKVETAVCSWREYYGKGPYGTSE